MKKVLLTGMISMIFVLLISVGSMAQGLEQYTKTFYQDQNSNYSMVLLKPANESTSLQENIMLIIQNDQYFRLDPGYLNQSGLPTEPIIPGNYEFTMNYDPEANVIKGQMDWLLSPDGTWGFFITKPLKFSGFRSAFGSEVLFRSCFFKNMQTGRIHREVLAWDAYTPASFYWMPDNILLHCRYSPNDSKNIIAVYDPAATPENPMTAFKEVEKLYTTYNYKKLVDGTLLSYDRDTNHVAFVKNEPSRRKYLLNLTTMQLQSTNEYISNFNHSNYVMAPSTYIPPVIIIPEDLELKEIPLVSPKVDFRYQHLLQVDGHEISLPMAYYWNHSYTSPHVPLRQLINTYSLSFDTNFIKDYATISIYAPNNKQIGTWSTEAGLFPPILTGTVDKIVNNIYINSDSFFNSLKKSTNLPEGEWNVTPLLYEK